MVVAVMAMTGWYAWRCGTNASGLGAGCATASGLASTTPTTATRTPSGSMSAPPTATLPNQVRAVSSLTTAARHAVGVSRASVSRDPNTPMISTVVPSLSSTVWPSK